ncbi:MAG: exo-alpha-sialidase [Chlamydiae bacterium]|nr:exo-alpha-sialidase [Chlamydiota bacterium]
MNKYKHLVFLSFVWISSLCFADRPWIVKEEFISPAVEHFDCHSSNIIETFPGSLCAVWKGGFTEGHCNVDSKDNIGIWASLFQNGAWTEAKEIVSSPNTVCWSPVLCKLSSSELLLFYRMGPNPRSLVSFIKRSYDGGSTWSKEELLPAGIIGPTKTKPLVLGNTLLCPSSSEAGEPDAQHKATACWIEIYDDAAHTWKKIGPLQIPNRSFGVIEPTLYMTSSNQIKMFCRDRAHKIGQTGYVWTASSDDFGNSWSTLSPTPLPNPDSGVDVVNLGNGRAALFYNHSHTERFPLSFAVSFDDCASWSAPFTVEKTSGEFPSAILDSEGMIHVSYAFSSPGETQRRIKHVVIDLKYVKITSQ